MLSNEQGQASLSVFDPNNTVTLTDYDGELITKEVSITANLELDGTETEPTMVITMQKAVLTGADGTVIDGSWSSRGSTSALATARVREPHERARPPVPVGGASPARVPSPAPGWAPVTRSQ